MNTYYIKHSQGYRPYVSAFFILSFTPKKSKLIIDSSAIDIYFSVNAQFVSNQARQLHSHTEVMTSNIHMFVCDNSKMRQSLPESILL